MFSVGSFIFMKGEKIMKKFKLGQLLVTAGVDRRMKADVRFKEFVINSLGCYATCDWGNTCEEDAKANNDAVENGERVFAIYIHKETDTKIWIITEWDRSVTTVLFPEEY